MIITFLILLLLIVIIHCDSKSSRSSSNSNSNSNSITTNINKSKNNKNKGSSSSSSNSDDSSSDYPSLSSKDFMFCGGISTDTIKVIQQSSRNPLNLFDTYRSVKATKGVTGLYKGAIGYSITDGLGSALFFSVYESSKLLASKYLSGPQLGASSFISAASAFLVSSCALVPAEVIKTRMQTGAYNDILHCVQDAVMKFNTKINKYEFNPFGLYTGYGATVGRDLPYFALQLGFYGNIRNVIVKIIENRVTDKKKRDDIINSGSVDLAAGTMSGLLTAVLTTPMDVAAARLITQNKAGLVLGVVPYKGFFDCMIRMAKEEGPKSFFIGVKARVSNIAPFCAISLTINESLKRILENRRNRK